MKKALLVLIIAAGVFLGWEGYKLLTFRMKGPRWDNLLPEMQQRMRSFLKEANDAGYDVLFYDGWRSVDEQQERINDGSSQVTDPYNSKHPWGVAADIAFHETREQPKQPDAKDPRWAKLKEIGERHGLKQPISWDKPHWELADISFASIRNEYGTDYKSYLSDNGVSV